MPLWLGEIFEERAGTCSAWTVTLQMSVRRDESYLMRCGNICK
jgi:hypothetical protein